MREQLIQYVNLLFAGAPQAADMKEEILQNTLDRYDDLVSQGKSPQAAYSLAISGIGDINEILAGQTEEAPAEPIVPSQPVTPQNSEDNQSSPRQRIFRAVAVALYILCPIPLFIFQNTAGLCLLLVLVAIATCLIVFSGKSNPDKEDSDDDDDEDDAETDNPKKALRKSIDTLIWVIGLVAYFVISFATGGWYITWVIFPMIGAVQGLVKACMDFKEAPKDEN